MGSNDSSQRLRDVADVINSITSARDTFDGYLEYDGLSSLADAQRRLERLLGRSVLASEVRILVYCNGLFHFWTFLSEFYELWKAGVNAMQASREQQHCIACSYAYPVWLFSHRNLPMPRYPSYWISRRDSSFSPAARLYHWNLSVGQTIRNLDDNLESQSPASLRSAIVRRLPTIDLDWLYAASSSQIYDLTKHIICGDFNNDPRLAQAAFLMKSTKELSSINRRTTLRIAETHPYDPGI